MKKALVASLVGLVMSSSAFAWGDREQGALAGLIVGGIIGSQARAAERYEPRYDPRYEPRVIVQPPVVIQQQEQIIVYPAPRQRYRAPLCLLHPHYDQYGQLMGYERSCH